MANEKKMAKESGAPVAPTLEPDTALDAPIDAPPPVKAEDTLPALPNALHAMRPPPALDEDDEVPALSPASAFYALPRSLRPQHMGHDIPHWSEVPEPVRAAWLADMETEKQALAGEYEVVHGRVHLHGDTYAEMGQRCDFNAEDGQMLMKAGILKKVAK